jgi:ABC-type phosphate/phosphonate transport system permease subunit
MKNDKPNFLSKLRRELFNSNFLVFMLSYTIVCLVTINVFGYGTLAAIVFASIAGIWAERRWEKSAPPQPD